MPRRQPLLRFDIVTVSTECVRILWTSDPDSVLKTISLSLFVNATMASMVCVWSTWLYLVCKMLLYSLNKRCGVTGDSCDVDSNACEPVSPCLQSECFDVAAENITFSDGRTFECGPCNVGYVKVGDEFSSCTG